MTHKKVAYTKQTRYNIIASASFCLLTRVHNTLQNRISGLRFAFLVVPPTRFVASFRDQPPLNVQTPFFFYQNRDVGKALHGHTHVFDC
jgi:hypothetical protein